MKKFKEFKPFKPVSIAKSTIHNSLMYYYNYFIIKDYIEGEPTFFICDKHTLRFLSTNDKTTTLKDLIDFGYVIDTTFKVRPKPNELDKTKYYTICLARDCYHDNVYFETDDIYLNKAIPKISKCIKFGNKVEYAFESKSIDEFNDTFRVVGSFKKLDKAKDFLLEIQEACNCNTPLKKCDTITPYRLAYNKEMESHLTPKATVEVVRKYTIGNQDKDNELNK